MQQSCVIICSVVIDIWHKAMHVTCCRVIPAVISTLCSIVVFPGMQHVPGLTPVMLNCEGNMDRALNWNGCANCLLNSTHTSAVPMLSGISVVVFTREMRSSGRGKWNGGESEQSKNLSCTTVSIILVTTIIQLAYHHHPGSPLVLSGIFQGKSAAEHSWCSRWMSVFLPPPEQCYHHWCWIVHIIGCLEVRTSSSGQ